MSKAQDILDLITEVTTYDIDDLHGPAESKKVRVGDILTSDTPNEKGKAKVVKIEPCPLSTRDDPLWTLKALTKMTFKKGEIAKGATFVWGPWGAANSPEDYKAKKTLN